MRQSKPREVLVPDAGTFFKYRWTKRRLFPGGAFGLAQALAFDETWGVVHVRVLSSLDGPEDPVSIEFLPILATSLEASLLSRLEQHPVPLSHYWSALSIWRELHAKEEAGAFHSQLFEAVEATWETVRSGKPEASEENTVVEYSFPVRGGAATYSSVRVSARER